MNKWMMVGTAMAVALAACSKPNDEADNNTGAIGNAAMSDNTAADADASASATAPVAAGDFANMVAASDRFEIESGRLAASKASSAEVKSFAQMLVTDHQKSSAELKTVASQSSPAIVPDDEIDPEKQGMLGMLQSANGADFDRQFIDQQIAAHEKALSLLQNYAAAGDNEALRGFATKAATVVQGHLDKARSLKK